MASFGNGPLAKEEKERIKRREQLGDEVRRQSNFQLDRLWKRFPGVAIRGYYTPQGTWAYLVMHGKTQLATGFTWDEAVANALKLKPPKKVRK